MKHIASPLLRLPEKCICANFVRRIKRFSVQLEHEGQIIWAHTNNTGAMLGLRQPGCLAMLSPATGKNRKLPYTLERIRIGHGHGGFWAGVNTSVPNRLLEAAFHAGRLPFANGYDSIKREAGKGNSRLDAHICGKGLPDLWVECKNVTLVEDGVAAFPDAASERGRKHLGELMEIVAEGRRAAMFYVVQRPDGKCFAPADYIDPEYARLFYMAMEKGVEMYAFQAAQTDAGIDLGEPLRILPRFAEL